MTEPFDVPFNCESRNLKILIHVTSAQGNHEFVATLYPRDLNRLEP
jgi:hypothetical protein